MGCGSSSNAEAPGKYNDDPDMMDSESRTMFDKKTGKYVSCAEGKDEDGPESDFFEVEEAQGEQFMAVRPWIGQVAEPDNHNPVDKSVPDTQYSLEYVYGYRCADSKQNVYWNSANQAVYMTAALGVILDKDSNTQKFFGGGEVENTAKNRAKDMDHHTDDVMAISVSPDRATAVSGQVGSSPTIFCWDACTGEKKQRIKVGKGARGIAAVAINAEGWVAAVDLHNEHQVYVFDNNGSMVYKEKGDTNKIHDVAWCEQGQRIATAGVKHIYFWNKNSPDKKKGLFSGNPQTSFACVAWDDQGKAWTGGSNSKIYIWGGDDGRTCEKTVEGHSKGFISAMRFSGHMYSGGKDGKVICWNQHDYTQMMIIDMNCLVRAIDFNGSSLLIGTRDGSISVTSNGEVTGTIMNSHSDGEVWGLAHGHDGTIVTSGDDNKVMIWDVQNRKLDKVAKVTDRVKKIRRGASTLSKYPDSQCSRCVATNGSLMAVSGNDGQVSVRNISEPNEIVHEITEPKEWNEVMAFSPDGAYLAVGSHDNNIYVYSTSDFALVGTCRGHNSYIMALDWCAHSKYIRSNCGAYELLFFTVPDCQQDKSGRSNTTSVEWASKTVKFQWETSGIYPRGTDGTHINSVAGSADHQLMATGDDFGLVNLFRDPAVQGAKPRSYRGHSEHVVRVMFSKDDGKLYSIGGYDQTMMQWTKC